MQNRFNVEAPKKFNPSLWKDWGTKWCFQLVKERKGTINNGSRTIEGDRRREETRETVPYLCKQQHAGLGITHIHVRAKTGMLNPSGICWHDGTPYAHVWHTHTHGSVTVAIGRGRGRKGKGGSGRDQHEVHVLHIINAFTSGWKGDERGMGHDETKVHCRERDWEMDR